MLQFFVEYLFVMRRNKGRKKERKKRRQGIIECLDLEAYNYFFRAVE
ncbi:hypothetical protein HanIR_Chr08g0364101 [Helianthus annuus]|nr:hypothetical protein HanIR_Chr08g0364101 [Helianthus annuus]